MFKLPFTVNKNHYVSFPISDKYSDHVVNNLYEALDIYSEAYNDDIEMWITYDVFNEVTVIKFNCLRYDKNFLSILQEILSEIENEEDIF